MWAALDGRRLDPAVPTWAQGLDDRPRGPTNPISVPCSPIGRAPAAIFDRRDLAAVTGPRRCLDKWAAVIVRIDQAQVAQSVRLFPPIGPRRAQLQGTDLEQGIDPAAQVAVTAIDRDGPSGPEPVAIDRRLCLVKLVAIALDVLARAAIDQRPVPVRSVEIALAQIAREETVLVARVRFDQAGKEIDPTDPTAR